jgi:hypothetical protein
MYNKAESVFERLEILSGEYKSFTFPSFYLDISNFFFCTESINFFEYILRNIFANKLNSKLAGSGL